MSAVELVEVLRRHEWNHLVKGCACGWSQRGMARGMERVNHPHHVASVLVAADLAVDQVEAGDGWTCPRCYHANRGRRLACSMCEYVVKEWDVPPR